MKFNRSVIGMIHVPALPGTPRSRLSIKEILKIVEKEARIYHKAGIDAIAIENMHDVPYLNRRVGPEIVAMMTRLGHLVKQTTDLPCGMQILAGANRAALAAAQAAEMDFIRAEGFVFSHVADEGMMHSDAGTLLRYRKQIGAENIMILTDIKKKHSAHALTTDVDLVETAEAARFFLSDGLIITGTSTGLAADLTDIKAVRDQLDCPVLVGSGVTLENVSQYLPYCDGLIVGSWFKKNGHWTGALEEDRLIRFMEKVSNNR